jgi:hypothetical protein
MDLIRKESSQKGQTKDSESSGNPGGVDYVIERRRVMITQSGYVALTSLLGFVLVARRRKSPPASTCARAGGDFACDHEPQAAEESSHHRGEATRQRRDPAVRVRDNRNFMPGMEIRARQDEHYPDVFVLVGRTPRYRGRW